MFNWYLEAHTHAEMTLNTLKKYHYLHQLKHKV